MVEDMAQATTEPGGRTVTREELFSELKELTEEVSCLKTGYSRQMSKPKESVGVQPVIDAPEGYESYLEYRLHRIVDLAFNHSTQHGRNDIPTWHDRYFTMIDGLRLERDQLRTYAARRSGDPHTNDRWQDPTQWEEWVNGDPAPRSVGIIRRWARVRFEDGMPYEQTLWEVANQVMMYSNTLLDRRRADTIKKSVDREYQARYDEIAPDPPQGWWHPAPDAGELTLGGLTILGLAWYPPGPPLITHWDPPPRTGEHPWFDEART